MVSKTSLNIGFTKLINVWLRLSIEYTKYKHYQSVAQYVIFLQIDDNLDVLTGCLTRDGGILS